MANAVQTSENVLTSSSGWNGVLDNLLAGVTTGLNTWGNLEIGKEIMREEAKIRELYGPKNFTPVSQPVQNVIDRQNRQNQTNWLLIGGAGFLVLLVVLVLIFKMGS